MVMMGRRDEGRISATDRLRAYAILGLTPRATEAEVVEAFRRALSERHIDRHGGNGDTSETTQVVWARKVLTESAGQRPTLIGLLNESHVLRRLVPRAQGFFYNPSHPVDGRDRLVRVVSSTVTDGLIACLGSDGEHYHVFRPDGDVPKGYALRLDGQGEPGRNEGEPGHLFLWFP